MTNTLPRRRLLSVSAGSALVATSLSGCDLLSTDPDGGGNDSGEQSTDAKEAPMLAEQVEAGDLPALSERLPEEPLVIDVVEQTGNYGGEWRTATTGSADSPWLLYTMGYDLPLRYDVDSGEVNPNIFASATVNDDGTEFTLQLRKGLKWSNGTPFTADDIVFAVQDVFLNEELSPAPPIWFVSGDTPGDAEKIDNHTVQISFTEPRGIFMSLLATGDCRGLISHPKHYLQQFHSKYEGNVEQLAADAGLEDWVQLFQQKADFWDNPELPTLQPWILTSPLADTGGRAVSTRNPYYWKVDPEGRQLPYVDGVVYDLFNEEEAMLLRAVEGRLDLHLRHFNLLPNKPILAGSQEDNDYRLFDIVPERMCANVISLNLTHPDEIKRSVFSSKDFRIGLSHAINRDEIVDAVYQRQGEPYQAAPRPESPFHDEEFAKLYVSYDPELANRHLDEVIPDKDSDGFRLDPNGDRLIIAVEVALGFNPTDVEVMELVRGYWRDVGVETQVKSEERTLFVERVTGNQHDACVWAGDGGGLDLIVRPRFYVPTGHNSRCDYAIAWADWYTSAGQEGEEPPDRVKEYFNIFEQSQATADEEERDTLIRELIESAKTEFYVIGITLAPMSYGVVKNSFRNVPAPMQESVLYPPPGNTEPSQYFIER